MKICVVCNSNEVCGPDSDYCKDCEETIKDLYEQQSEQELEEEIERAFKENVETESGTIVRTYEEIFDLIKDNVTELVDNLEFNLEENLNIENINIYEFQNELHDSLLEADFENHKLLLRYKSSGICDSPSYTVEYDIEFLINGISEFYYQLTYTNGEYELCDGSYIPVTLDDLHTDNEDSFIDNIINKLKKL